MAKSMLGKRSTRTIYVSDELWAEVKASAGESVSAFVELAVLDRLARVRRQADRARKGGSR